MVCPICKGTGVIVVEVPVFTDGGYTDVDQTEVACRCNPYATDDDAPDWEPSGTAPEDFRPRFNDARYEGI